MSDQSGRRRGRVFSFSNVCFCLSDILSTSFASFPLFAAPGGGGGGAGGAGGGGGGTETIPIFRQKY